MNETSKEYCRKLASMSNKSMEQINSSMMMLMQQCGRGAGIDTRLKLLLDDINQSTDSEDNAIGNKRNGTKDRRQAFGGLF